MYSLSVHSMELNVTGMSCAGQIAEDGNTEADKVIREEEGNASIEALSSSAVTSSIGEEDEEEEDDEGEEGGVTSGREVQEYE